MLDLVDLLRTDISDNSEDRPSLQMLNRAKERFETLSSKEQADIYKKAIEAAERRKLPSNCRLSTDIIFLPSWTDCYWNKRVNIWDSSYCDEEGWTPGNNTDLQGVAASPAGTLSDVQEVIVRKLKKQGVIFLNKDETKEYLNNEGAYWAWKNLTIRSLYGGHHGARKVKTSEKMKWQLRKPETPIYDRWQSRQVLVGR